MPATSIVLAHLALFRMQELVQEGVRLASGRSFAEGDLNHAAILLGCGRVDPEALLKLTATTLPDLSGPVVWSPRPTRPSRKELEMEIETALVQALGDFGSSYEIADFYQTNPTLVQRRRRTREPGLDVV